MNDRWVYLNGELVEKNRASVSVLDRGLLFGDGAFETMRSYGGRIFAFERHARRLFEALAALRFSIPENEKELSEAAHDLLRKNNLNDVAIRITVTRGVAEGPLGLPAASAPTRIIHCRPLLLPDYEKGVAAVLSAQTFSKSPVLAGLKSLNYLDNLFARQEAHEKGAFEAIMMDAAGRIVEGASSNVFAVFGGEVRTPPLSSGALPGITRAVCLDLLQKENIPAREADLRREDLARAGEVFITNSVMEILSVVKIDGLPVEDGKPGPVCRWLQKKYRELIEIIPSQGAAQAGPAGV